MKRWISIRIVFDLVYFLFGFLPIATLGVIFYVVSPKLHEEIKGPIWRVICILEGLALVELIIQLTVSRAFSKSIKNIIETVGRVQQGDLTITPGEYSFSELNELSQGVGSIIKQFHDVMANVFVSMEQVKHLTGVVNDTAGQSSHAAGEISASSESVAKGAGQQAEDAEACLAISNGLIQKMESAANSAELMSKKADIVQQMTEFGQQNISELTHKSKLSERH